MLKKIGGNLFISMIIIMLFTGCGVNRQDQQMIVLEKKTVSAMQGENSMEITMTSGKTVIEAILEDNETSRQFIARLPMTIRMKRFDDREYYVPIANLSEEGPKISDYENGDVTYYTGGPSFAVFFAKSGQSSQGNLIRLGKVISDLSLFEHWDNEAEVKIEVKRK
jgi:Uncharacterized conserved protein